ncbi:hypothetical protein COO91_09409 (plasmid) [Nostoc flagelliforme CCNUN1]|uniref:Uncharacterized protein n=1 Tax=Nostoc flagelliforme CCNUN1 TaxID=2038116 RepID=A0A2K8T6A3_9NOSO|nr:hypothetical protein [Nostoc flagelliforme]AUB43236.1 hypothetical protein COO91_09409 [Nostoc flagelliforme CCNUN1]
MLEDNELTTGIVQHPVTKRWQTWISFTGNDIQCITAHANPDDADRVAKQIADAWSEGKYKTGEEVTAFIKSLPTDAVVDPLPQNLVMQLSKQALSTRK